MVKPTSKLCTRDYVVQGVRIIDLPSVRFFQIISFVSARGETKQVPPTVVHLSTTAVLTFVQSLSICEENPRSHIYGRFILNVKTVRNEGLGHCQQKGAENANYSLQEDGIRHHTTDLMKLRLHSIIEAIVQPSSNSYRRSATLMPTPSFHACYDWDGYRGTE